MIRACRATRYVLCCDNFSEFLANASITGANVDASYEFDLVNPSDPILEQMTFDSMDFLDTTISHPALAAGDYEVALIADGPDGPDISITLGTSV